MKFPQKPIIGARFPALENEITPIIRLAAVPDCSQQIGAVVGEFKMRGLNIDLVDPDADLLEYCDTYRPDALMLNTDTLPLEELYRLTEKLGESDSLPRMVITVARDILRSKPFGKLFPIHIQIDPPVYPPKDAEFIEKLLAQRLISDDYYRMKLKQIAELTLNTLHCPSDAVGFEPLCLAVVEVLCDPFRYRRDQHELINSAAQQLKIDATKASTDVNRLIGRSVRHMTAAEFLALFYREPDEHRNILPMEYICSAARLAANPARNILSEMNTEPFPYREEKLRFFK